MAGEGKERTSKTSKLGLAKIAAALVGLLLLGVMASGALADGDPFSAISAITGTSTSPDATGAFSTGSDTTGTSTDAATSTDVTTSDADATTTDSTTTDATTTTDPTTATTTTTAALPPTISTDKLDYPQGSTVTLTGSGWGAAEAVHLFVNDTVGQTWSYSTDVTADLSGTFTIQFQLANYFISDYNVTATGAAGETATTAFTDAGSLTLAPTSGSVGTSVTVTTGGGVFDGNASNIGVYWDGTLNTTNGTLVATCGTNGGGNVNTGCSLAVPSGAAAGPHTVIATEQSNTSKSLNAAFTVTVLGPTKLAFTTAAATGAVGQCLGPITVQTQNPSGTAANVTATTTVNLTTDDGGTGAGAFYSDNVCSSSATTRSIASGSNSASFFYKATGRGMGTHTLTAAASGLTSVSQNETINKANQTITFTVPTGKTFGDADFDPGATASSGLAVSYSSTTLGVCTIVSGKVHIVAAGSCSVTAAQAGDNNYNAATSVSQTFTIAAKSVTITPNSGPSKVFGASDPTLTFTNDGGLASGAFTGALSRVAGENVGIYAITLGTLSAGPNYSLSLSTTTVNFAITAKPVTITPGSDQSKVFGDADPTFTFTNDGGLAAGAFTGALSRVAGENAGTYAITLGTLAAGPNYNLSLSATTVNFTINRAPGAVSIATSRAAQPTAEASPPCTRCWETGHPRLSQKHRLSARPQEIWSATPLRGSASSTQRSRKGRITSLPPGQPRASRSTRNRSPSRPTAVKARCTAAPTRH
jgi:hypothetical protein